MIKIEVHSTRAVIRSQEPLTVGLRGATARFSFGETWEPLIKTAVFRQGEKTVTVADIGPEVTIPWEVLTQAGLPVQIGVYGTDSTGAVAIPTVWATTQPVCPGTDPEGDPSTEPTPGLWEQLQGKLGSLEQLDTTDKSSLVAAINEANRAVFAVTVSGTEGNYSTDCSMGALKEAWEAGKLLLCFWEEQGRWMPVFQVYERETGVFLFDFSTTAINRAYYIRMQGMSDGAVTITAAQTVLATEQSKLPNPQKLIFSGALEAEYDGSEDISVKIPGKISDLVNDSDFLTEAPVKSVNGQTGDVTVPTVLKITITKQADSSYDTGGIYSEEIVEASNAGKMVYCQNGYRMLTLLYATYSRCIFGCVHAGYVHTVTIGASGVSVASTPLATGDGSGSGADGITPHIGDNGNWFIGETDTGMPSRGEDGASPNVKVRRESDRATISVTYPDGTFSSTFVEDGKDGEDGYTPVKGADYYTAEEKAEFESMIAQELARRGQLKPEFANSVEECTDTSKLYVLPDGYVYAYIGVTTVKTYTNQLDTAGYKSGYRLSSSGEETAYDGSYVTGYIPCHAGDTVRLKNVVFQTGVTSGLTSTNQRLAYYDSNKTFLAVANADAIITAATSYQPVTDGSGIITQFTIPSNATDRAYIRLNGSYIGSDSVITVNEEMVDGTETTYTWTNTGHAFVPADYESRIVNLESRVEGLQPEAVDGVPSYVQQEAERVADLIQSKRTAKSLVFAALSDVHYPYDDAFDGDANTAQSMRHAGMGISQIRRWLPLDFIGLFGDYAAGGRNSTIAETKATLKFVHNAMYEAGLGVQQIWMQGNHDRNPYDTDDGDLTDDELYNYIFSHNVGTVTDNDHPQRGYGYKDFEAQKLRVVYWNSSDISGVVNVTDHCFSADQYRWMADTAFNFSDKADPTEWGIIMFSHMPVNWSGQLTSFVDAYISGSGTTVTAADNVTVSVDFTDTERAEFICAVNGHTHNFRYSQVGTNRFWQIAVPQICAGRYNEYGTSWPEVGGEVDSSGNPVYYPKIADSAQSTSFCVFVVDRKNRKIHALHYGAGIDREISY